MVKGTQRSSRFQRIKADLLSAPVHLCLERAELITTFFRRINDRKEPVIVQKAKALRYLLQHKSVRIFADELIAGNVGRHRKSALRDPNFQVRLHRNSPAKYVKRATEVVKRGRGVPAFFNDETVVASLVAHGYPVSEARDYGIVGCVEQAIPGKSFLSTDAALFNLPICLELALNQGRRRGRRHRTGAATPESSSFTDIEMVIDAFKLQVQTMVGRMIKDLQIMEKGNRDFHPTPLSSMLVEGCLQSGRDVTAGGAIYNSSGRKAGRPFAASMGAVNGSDRLGPTALLNSVAHLDAALAANGYALNLRFDPNTLAGPGGEEILPSLVTGFFDSGGMEVQFNILDPLQLQDARNNPGKYPDLVVRVAGYCAYFDDLPDVVKKEVIARTRQMQ